MASLENEKWKISHQPPGETKEQIEYRIWRMVESVELRAESLELKPASSRQPPGKTAESREYGAESGEQRAESREPCRLRSIGN